MIQIVSDSTCDLSAELIEKYGIKILPLHVMLGEEEHRDGVDITPDELYKWADANKTTPKTSAPSMEDVKEIFEPILEAGNEIICFTISASMSTSINCIKLVVDELEAEDRVSIIDSANLSTGIGLQVLEAAVMAESGKDRASIVAEIERIKPLVRASFVVDTLTYLHRGGRCSGVAAIAGTMLRLHPSIHVVDGAMVVGKKYRGKYDGIVLNYVKDMEDDIRKAKTDRIFITHSGIDEDIINKVKDYLNDMGIFKEILVTRAGSVISSHCGYGTLGVLFILEK